MRKFLQIFLILTSLGMMTSCNQSLEGNGKVVTVNKEQTEHFTQLNIQGSYQVTLVQGSAYNVQLKMDENLIDNTEIKLSGKELEIKEKALVEKKTQYELVITVPDLAKITLDRNVNLTINQPFVATDLKIVLAGNTKFNGSIKTKNIEIATAENAEIDLFGEAESLEITAKGNSNVNVFDFQANTVETDASDNANLQVYPIEKLKGSAEDNATVKCREGDFDKDDYQTNGKAEVITISEKVKEIPTDGDGTETEETTQP